MLRKLFSAVILLIIQSNNSKTAYFTTQVETESQYDAFGNITEGQTVSSIGYSGEYLDTETGLYYLSARFYDPELGRFTQENDWLTEGPNLYIYCKNNPVLFSDPSGHCNAVDLVYYRRKGDIETLEKLKRPIANGDCDPRYHYDSNDVGIRTYIAPTDFTQAFFVVDYTEYGLPIIGHARLYIMDINQKWWMTEFTGDGFDKSSARVTTKKVSLKQINDDINQGVLTTIFNSKEIKIHGTEYAYISGDFTVSLQSAIKYNNEQNYPHYNLLTNNCLHYIQLILSKGITTQKKNKIFLHLLTKLFRSVI